MTDNRRVLLTPARSGWRGFVASVESLVRVRRAPLIDKGLGLIYDVERNITWLKDANYAATTRRTSDGQLSWDDAMSWLAGLEYCGIAGWRLPTALDPGETSPYVGANCSRGELGHLFHVASRMPPNSIVAENFNSWSIYWTSTEASATEAFAFKLSGLEQGKLDKGFAVPTGNLVLAWPVHDGDVYALLDPT
jgi:hypothetical protein